MGVETGGRPERLRVLFFSASLGGGGAEKNLVRVINRMDRERFEPALAVAIPGGEYEPELAADVAISALKRGRPRFSLPRVLGSAWPLRRVVRDWRPDVLCAVQDHAAVAAAMSMSGLSSRPRLVANIQNTPSVRLRRGRRPGQRLLWALAQRLYARIDRFAAASRGVADDLEASIPAARGRVEVISNAIDDRAAELAAERLPEERPAERLVVACGRLTEQKGFSHLVRAFAEVARRIPAQLWILGEGPERRSLEQLARTLGVGDRVRLLGFRQNPFCYFAAADLFASSSLWEGFQLVLMEAAACGAPIVASDCPHGPAELLDGGRCGILVPPADSAALAAAMTAVLSDADLAAELAAKGRQRAAAYTAGQAAEGFGELFTRLSRREDG